jgi:hypothetical protein
MKLGWHQACFLGSKAGGNFLVYFYFQPTYFIYTKVVVDTELAV